LSNNNSNFDFNVSIDLSGQRFKVVYSITGSEIEAHAKAGAVCVEQTIEFPAELVKGGDIRSRILGHIESFEFLTPDRWEASISYPVEISAFEFTQLVNVMFGNISMKPGIRVERLELPESLLKIFKGPRFGIQGLRELLEVPDRPLFCTALKPMGLSAKVMADLAYRFAVGGVDMIKDDHSLTNQPFASFEERVKRCVEAIDQANRETGKKCLYIPNITAPADQIPGKALFAKKNGVGGLMAAPGLIGLDTMRQLAEDDALDLPIISHPAFQGSFVINPENGVSHYALFGQLPRLAGADGVIFPNYGGRFPFSRDDCRQVVKGATVSMHHIKPIFSMPGGGMSLERIPEMLQTYGKDVIFLIGGALHKMGPDLVENCRIYMKALQ
jgi:ribulose-bisphosphate carboxylase large chain